MRLLLLLLAAMLAPGVALAAYPQVYASVGKADVAQITNATGTGQVTLTTAGANGSRRNSLSCSNTDTNPYNLQVFKVRSATSYLLGTVTIAASSGNAAGTPRVNVLTPNNFPGLPVDQTGNSYITAESGDTITIASTGTVSATKIISCTTDGVDF